MWKRVKVNDWEKALVFKRKQLVKVLNPGKYWVFIFYRIEKADINKLFTTKFNLEYVLKQDILSMYLDILMVKDYELGILYLNGNFQSILLPGRYIFWKNSSVYTYQVLNLNVYTIPENIEIKVLKRSEFAPYVLSYYIDVYENGLLYVNGEFIKVLVPGVYYYLLGQQSVKVVIVDLRKQLMEISGQELLTKNKASLRINFYAFYQITDLIKSMVENKDVTKQLYTLLQLGLREFVGQLSLDELLTNKNAVSEAVIQFMMQHLSGLGIELSACGIRDIILPGEVKEIMSEVLIAEKKAEANIITRREETASTRSLLNTAKLLEDNTMLYKLKELEYLEKIADKIQNINLSGGGQLLDQLKGLLFKN